MKKIIHILLCIAIVISLSSCSVIDKISSGLSKDRVDNSNRIISVANERGERLILAAYTHGILYS